MFLLAFTMKIKTLFVVSTLESLIIGGGGIIGGGWGRGLDIVIIINNRRGRNNRGVGRGRKNSVGGFLVLIF